MSIDEDLASPYLSDRASAYARELQDLHVTELLEADEREIDQEAQMRLDLRRSLFSKIEFRWRSSDKRILDQLRRAVDKAFSDLFSDAFAAIDRFYEELRVPETNEAGSTLLDSTGRVVWRKDPTTGQVIEEWGQLTGQDIEKCLLDLSRLKLAIAPQVNDLLMEAVFAKNVANDSFQEAYAKVIDGTVGDRTAAAHAASLEDKYHAFYLYYLYSHADAFRRELDNFTRTLDRICYFRIANQKG